MVYETDFYTTRRPYSRPTITSYSVTRRQVPWEKVPTVPRPSQVPPPFTVYGSKGNYYSGNAAPKSCFSHKKLLFSSIPSYRFY
uniref:Unkown protein n=1 Tax=Riptortus pedestris TaxID=329032 RepID=R4WCX4_RIPPE|nr:unkown protein [Riptortus pedestris]